MAPRIIQATTASNNYTTYHYDNLRTGWNPNETILTISNVASSHFGVLHTLSVDGTVFAQPLYVANLLIAGALHNTLFVATENDSLYAFDADTGTLLWHRSFINPGAGIYAVDPTSIDGCKKTSTVVGITGTPVITVAANALYVVDYTKQVSISGSVTLHHKLHAINILTGFDYAGSPVEIRASTILTNGTIASFSAQAQKQRPGLLLANGAVYVAFGSNCDLLGQASHGWIIAYDALSLKQVASFVATRTPSPYSLGYLGSFWAGGFAPAADASGYVYAVTGNGWFDVNTGGLDYGDSVLKLSPALAVNDYFTPANWYSLISGSLDLDLGSGGIMLLPTQPAGVTYPYLAVAGGKDGRIFLFNRSNLGQYHSSGDKVLQELTNATGGVDGGPGYYNGGSTAGQIIYYCGSSNGYPYGPLKAYLLQTAPSPKLVYIMSTADTFPLRGCIPVVSSNGQAAGTAIVWATSRPTSSTTHIHLRAYDALNLSHKLFDGLVALWPNGIYNRPFMVPTVINGKVYVGTGNSVVVYGLH